MKSIIGAEHKDEIIRLYHQGYNGRQIADKMGLTITSSSTVWYHIHKYNKMKHAALAGASKSQEQFSLKTVPEKETVKATPVTEVKKPSFSPKETERERELLLEVAALKSRIEVLNETLSYERNRK